MTPSEAEMAVEMLAEGTPAVKVAKALSIDLPEVLALIKKEDCPFPQLSLDGLGPEHLRKYYISRKKATSSKWPDEDRQKIETTRRLYDDGFVETVIKRDGEWMLWYSIPRKFKAVRRNPYFFLKPL